MIFKTYISINEIKKFALNSLDKNPIHLDFKIARRQIYGKKISHGALLIEKFLVHFFNRKNYIINKFECYFLNPCEINSKLIYKYSFTNSKVTCNIFVSNKKICFFEFNYKNNFSFDKFKNKKIKFIKIKKFDNILELKNFTKKKKKFIRTYDNKKNIFINILYNLSRVIGMEIPGYYSLFLSFNLTFNENNTKSNNYYKVNNIISEVNLIETEYCFDNYNLNSKSFLLKPPLNFFKILKFKFFSKKNIKNQNKKVLILGGSRGLGLISTYYFLQRGYKVFSTYSIFNDYLKKINNRNLKIIKYDIKTNQNFEKIISIAQKSEYLMFFASPKIIDQKNKFFDNNYFNQINDYNKKFIKIINKLYNKKKIFYPSTFFLDLNKSINFAEYKRSKYLMENYFKKNIIKHISFVPRLPRYNTDQNNLNLNNEKITNILKFKKYLKKFENI